MLGTHRETCGPRPSRAFGCQTPGVRGRARPRSSPVGGRGSGSDQPPSSLHQTYDQQWLKRPGCWGLIGRRAVRGPRGRSGVKPRAFVVVLAHGPLRWVVGAPALINPLRLCTFLKGDHSWGFRIIPSPKVLDEDFMSPKTSVCGFMSRVQGAGEAPQAEHAALAVVCGSQWDRDLDVKIQVHLRFSGLLRKSRDSKSQSIVATNEFCRRRVNRGNQLESTLLLRTVTVERRGGTALGNGGTPVYKLPMRRRTFSDSAMAICM